MKVKGLKQICNELKDEDEIFVAFYTKDEALEYLQENLNDGDEFPITDDEWEEVIITMDRDDGLWTEINNAWTDSLFSLYSKIKRKARV